MCGHEIASMMLWERHWLRVFEKGYRGGYLSQQGGNNTRLKNCMMKVAVNFTPHQTIFRAMAGGWDEPACSTYGRKEKHTQNFWWGRPNERDFNIQTWLKDMGWEIMEWIRGAELRSSSRLSWTRIWNSEFCKMGGFLTNQGSIRFWMNYQWSWLAARLEARNQFLISKFRHVLNVVCFLLGNSPASEILYADVSEHSVPSS